VICLETRQTERLESLGIPIFHEHSSENVGDIDVLVYSSAVKMENPEVRAARQNKIPVIRRAEALAELMRLKRGIAVAGTHGKTTTTSLAASSLVTAGLDPTVVVGGRLDMFESTAKLGQGEWLIAEADESDGSFHRLSPEVVIITNIDDDHLDHYGSTDALEKAFFDFAANIPFYGLAIVCGDDPRLKRAVTNLSKRYVTYGFDRDNDYSIEKSEGLYKVFDGAELIGHFTNSVPGDHNALNALAVIALGQHLGLSFSEAIEGIEGFKGVDRRFQKKGVVRGIDFYDDYGHHPTEVKATLKGFRDHFSNRKVRVIFQPHRYSRTELCWSDFLQSFHDADEVYVTEIYPAGEKPIENITAQRLVAEINHPHVSLFDIESDAQVEKFRKSLLEGDVVLTLGAGNIFRFGEALLEKMAKG
jgi:UDP-N-acetylmuramate--alanine ligase